MEDGQGLTWLAAQRQPIKGLPNLVRQYRELRTSLVRTHDMMGPAAIDAIFKFDNIWQERLILGGRLRVE